MKLATKPALTDALDFAIPSKVPTHWYNLAADFPEPMAPHLNPQTREALKPEELFPLFSKALVEQEFSTERWIEIPQAVREVYVSWRPSPLIRARRLERALGTKVKIYYKYEGVSPAGSHKPNSAVAQAYFNAIEGTHKLTTETGAGQWGASLSMACAMFGLKCEVFQVRSSFDAKPYRRMQMEAYGGVCHPSPSELTEAGRKMLEKDPNTTGSLGMAISEAVEVAVGSESAHYALGSALNHVMLHQTVIGQEAIEQLKEAGEEQADVVFACAGGGSNLAGISFPFLGENLRDGKTTRVVACEPEACPSLTQGEFRYDFGDVAGMTPLMKMYTLGHDFVPPSIHAGGLRYHGMSPMVSHAKSLGLIDSIAVGEHDTFRAGLYFARAEGIIPAPESTHAVAGALKYITSGEARDGEVVVIGVSGNGLLDLPAYENELERERQARAEARA